MKRFNVIVILVLIMISNLLLYGCDINNFSNEEEPKENIEEQPVDGGELCWE